MRIPPLSQQPITPTPVRFLLSQNITMTRITRLTIFVALFFLACCAFPCPVSLLHPPLHPAPIQSPPQPQQLYAQQSNGHMFQHLYGIRHSACGG